MRKIIVEELLRAGGVFILSMWILGTLKSKGALALSTLSLLAVGGGVSAAVFSVLVVLRTRTGKEFMLKRLRYLLILGLVFGVPVFIWLILSGEVTRAIFFAVAILLVYLLLFIFRKKAGLRW